MSDDIPVVGDSSAVAAEVVLSAALSEQALQRAL
jgi:hypothetical protein